MLYYLIFYYIILKYIILYYIILYYIILYCIILYYIIGRAREAQPADRRRLELQGRRGLPGAGQDLQGHTTTTTTTAATATTTNDKNTSSNSNIHSINKHINSTTTNHTTDNR